MILFWILIVLAVISILLTRDGYFERRTYPGWILFGVYLVIYLAFAIRWMSNLTLGTAAASFEAIRAFVTFSLLLALQGPMVAELITQMMMPDPSKGLKILEVHTEAERLVAQEDIPGAITEYEKIVEAEPEDALARCRLAELYFEVKAYKKAVAAYEAYLEHADKISVGDHCFTLTRLSEIYAQHLNNPQTARERLRTIVEKYPDTKYADYAQDRLEIL
jgi:tetratricopeptide (TPR) repeat protein